MLDVQELVAEAIHLSSIPDNPPADAVEKFYAQVEDALLEHDSDRLVEALQKVSQAGEGQAAGLLLSAIHFAMSTRASASEGNIARLLWCSAMLEIPSGARLPILNRQQRAELSAKLTRNLQEAHLLSPDVSLFLPHSFGTLADLPADFSAHRALLEDWAVHHTEPSFAAFPPLRETPFATAPIPRLAPVLFPVLFVGTDLDNPMSPLEEFTPFGLPENSSISLESVTAASQKWNQDFTSVTGIRLGIVLPTPFYACISALAQHLLTLGLSRVPDWIGSSDIPAEHRAPSSWSWLYYKTTEKGDLVAYVLRIKIADAVLDIPFFFGREDPLVFLQEMLSQNFTGITAQPVPEIPTTEQAVSLIEELPTFL